MIKKVYTERKISCIYYPENGVSPKHCESCTFANKLKRNKDGDITEVECIQDENPRFNCQVTSFDMNGDSYRIRKYDEEKDGPLKEEGDYCEKCYFRKKLRNDYEVCLLASCMNYEDAIFSCYDGEIWEKVDNGCNR